MSDGSADPDYKQNRRKPIGTLLKLSEQMREVSDLVDRVADTNVTPVAATPAAAGEVWRLCGQSFRRTVARCR